ncbi:ubiquitin-binding protein cue5 [Yamadazyma tenuis]|uniref:CUE domain-containing protein n=1 Tax=Candida tenuis (strain ATCC 10573 / BCRC 21748 / CBS 615 / JCM 9827 / NBRC 10315 / NRRL Y-1498 / VKM Y-70) TaxID=590646 RepID=G3BDS0_CANTC|nr:uncharacterized protein CANTEDRAFT_116414 [Yamadazyma tenuis ATCC 10573]XP_006690329.1 uncharacterized protein CANTEDRAFT_116414 [Yamadazyma tenuis ATCC 10573]EGV61114.1 hypothetical protein CANTEDRAFT_116414 [Yamadazyma tenuis ATCC 10573]EGV61115.1 hypothetical protein CANTEDRAFT_116414 [Yamadazyma tenuis ATCC 10573]WEJ94390.1 ubiquitin-binding protein cue5 [Yamadazyma tenuis]
MSSKQLKVVPNDPIELGDDGAAVSTPTEPETAAAIESKSTTPDVSTKPEESTKEEEVEVEEDEAPPPAPPRPVSPITAIKTNLKEAFPMLDDRIITGVLIASQGNLDTSFNALLYISDETIEEPEIPAAGVPAYEGSSLSASSTKVPVTETDDEALARKLQKEFELEERRSRRRQKEAQRRKLQHSDDDSPDEFDQIKETFTQGIEEARTTLNGWVSGLTKRFDGNETQSKKSSDPPKLFGALGGSSAQRNTRKFDEDPQIISNDFHQKISLDDNDDKGPVLPKRKTNDWNEGTTNVPLNSDAFMVTDSEDEDKKEIKL